MKILTKKNIKIIFIFLVFALGFYLRLMRYLKFDYFRGDEGNHFLLFDNLIRFKQFWITGEGSSLGDYDLNLYFHNMPYSLYFEFIIYVFANQSPLIYMFIYILLNMSLVYLIWQTNKNFFDERTGLITLFLASFSKHMISVSTFASQPTNALIFEVFGLYLLSLFYKKKNKKYLIISLISFLLALQMYPPMYLYLPVKIVFLFLLFHKEILKNKKLLLYVILILVITYLPMIINEINYYDQQYSNLYNVKSLINNGGFNTSDKATIINNTHSINAFVETVKRMTKLSLAGVNNNFQAHSFFIYPILLASIYLTKNKKQKLLIYYIIFSITAPIIILSILKINRPDYIGGLNAFYFVLLIAIGIGRLKKISNNLGVAAIFSISIFILTGVSFAKLPRSQHNYINFFERDSLVQQILNDTNRNLLTLNEIDMKVLNNNFPNNNGNWDSSIYWYLLQTNSDTQLVNSPYPFLTPKLINQPAKVTYFICEYEKSLANVSDCLETINYNFTYFNENTNQVLFENNKFILIRSLSGLNHNLIQDEL